MGRGVPGQLLLGPQESSGIFGSWGDSSVSKLHKQERLSLFFFPHGEWTRTSFSVGKCSIMELSPQPYYCKCIVLLFLKNESWSHIAGGANLVHRVSSKTAKDTQRNLVLKKQYLKQHTLIYMMYEYFACMYLHHVCGMCLVLQMVVSHPVGSGNWAGPSSRTVLALNGWASLQALLLFTVKHQWCTEAFCLSTLYIHEAVQSS